MTELALKNFNNTFYAIKQDIKLLMQFTHLCEQSYGINGKRGSIKPLNSEEIMCVELPRHYGYPARNYVDRTDGYRPIAMGSTFDGLYGLFYNATEYLTKRPAFIFDAETKTVVAAALESLRTALLSVKETALEPSSKELEGWEVEDPSDCCLSFSRKTKDQKPNSYPERYDCHSDKKLFNLLWLNLAYGSFAKYSTGQQPDQLGVHSDFLQLRMRQLDGRV